MNLRPYQANLNSAIYERWNAGDRRVLAQLPTGGGKTHVFSHVAHDFSQQGARTLVLAHREELVTQAAAKLQQATGEAVGIIKAGYPFEPEKQLQVASVRSLINRLDQTGPFDLVVTDEAHHATAASYQNILSHYNQALQLGVTATPCRSDGSGFADVFDALVTGPTTGKLIKLGHLSPFRLIADTNQMSTKGVRSHAGDYSNKQLAAANDCIQLAGSLVGSYLDQAMGKRAIVFAINVEHSKAIAAAYNAAGIPAAHLDGDSTSDERQAALSAFAAGDYKVLSNVALFTEGFDLPAIEVVQIARPTKSLSLWLQMLGRGLRTAPGKREALFIDHTSNWARLGLPTRPRVWTLDGVVVENMVATRSPSGEVVESEPIAIEETPAELQEVVIDPLEVWRKLWAELVLTQQAFGYKPGWFQYQLKDLNAPYEIWQLAGEHLGYKRGWAWYQWKSLQDSKAA